MKTKDSLTKVNRLDYSSYCDFNSIDNLISIVNAFARMTYQAVYLIDIYKQNFLYISDTPWFLCGHSAQEVKELNYNFYYKHIPKDEQELIIELNNKGLDFLDKLEIAKKKKCSISYDFHLEENKKQILINHKQTPLLLTDKGKIWINLCVVRFSNHKTPGNMEYHLDDISDYCDYSLSMHKWKLHQSVIIKEEEKEILRLSANGFTMDEISNIMCKSVNTIKFYKRTLFEKFEVSNIIEAISFAMNYNLL